MQKQKTRTRPLPHENDFLLGNNGYSILGFGRGQVPCLCFLIFSYLWLLRQRPMQHELGQQGYYLEI